MFLSLWIPTLLYRTWGSGCEVALTGTYLQPSTAPAALSPYDYCSNTRRQVPGRPLLVQRKRLPLESTISSPARCSPEFGGPPWACGMSLTAALPPDSSAP